eukprot:COSAG01_NODE_7763_length_3066_cov_35.319852_4_plen_80_part_00
MLPQNGVGSTLQKESTLHLVLRLDYAPGPPPSAASLEHYRRHGLQKLRRQPSENKNKSISAPNLAKFSCGSSRKELLFT